MPKTNLDEIQNQFWTHLLSRESDEGSLKKILVESDTLSAAKRMEIYSTAYYLRIHNALAEDFKDLARFIGEENFGILVTEYLSVVLSNHFSLRYMGARLPEFLERSHWIEKFPWAADLARFEWMKSDLFDGPDHEVVKRETLASVEPSKWPLIKFKLIPNLTLLRSDYRVEAASEVEEGQEKAFAFENRNHTIKIWRRDEEIYYSPIQDDEMKMMALVNTEKEFSVICESLLGENSQNPAEKVFEILSRWIDEGLVERVYY